MAKLWNKIIKNIALKNTSSGNSSGASSRGGSLGGRSSFNRDPKAIQVKRVGYQLVNGPGEASRDNFQGPLVDLNLIDAAIQRDSYIMQTMMKYSELIFKSGWHLKGTNEQALEYLKLRMEMIEVATEVPTEELFQGIADDIVRYGNSFIIKARARNGVGLPPGVSAVPIPPAREPVVGYFRLPPQTMGVARDENGNVVRYQQEVEGGGDSREYPPEDIIHIAVNRPAGRPFGEPWISPVLEDIRLLRRVEENAALLLYRHIFPLLSYTVGIDKPGYEASDEELMELQSVIENMPTDGAIVLPERHKIEAIKVDAIDGQPYLEYFEQRVFTGLGMSSVDMGRGDTANRNTADAMGGIKADRVKGWQKALETQIDKYIIDEILVEGGFDPLSNPEFDVDFVFEEIEQERKIAKENHAIQLWNSNLATFEETRNEIGKDPTVDENRLRFHMFGEVDDGTDAETDNKNAPENQSGKRTAPKRSSEFLNESVSSRLLEENVNELRDSLINIYSLVESDTLDVIHSHSKKKEFPIVNPKQWLSSFHFSKDKMIRSIRQNTKHALSEGINKARKDSKRNSYPSINSRQSMQVIEEYASDSLDKLSSLVESTLEERLKLSKNSEQALLAVKGVFTATKHRLTFISNTIIAKSYNYGYALSMMEYGEDELHSVYEGNCMLCQEKSSQPISLKEFSMLDEIAVFYRIPPWHPNCNCYLEMDTKSFKGGEE